MSIVERREKRGWGEQRLPGTVRSPQVAVRQAEGALPPARSLAQPARANSASSPGKIFALISSIGGRAPSKRIEASYRTRGIRKCCTKSPGKRPGTNEHLTRENTFHGAL